jgi:hypothetical protein
LSESCRISILRLVSKSQWACFTNEVSTDFCSELGNTFIFQFKFLPFLACLPPARVPFYMCSANPSHTHMLATYSSTLYLSHFPLFVSLLLPSFCFFGVCLPLCFKDGFTALIWASAYGKTACVELLLGAGADKEAKNKVREEKNHTRTCG